MNAAPRFWFGDRSGGDFADPVLAPHPGHDVPPRPWTWLRQVHGAEVVTVGHRGEHAGAEADAAVTATPGCGLSVRTADCAPVALLSAEAVGVAHAGWRGLLAGVVEATVERMQALGATRVTARIGPCISAPRYAFGGSPLDALVDRYGPEVSARSLDGAPALDLRAGVRAALVAAGADVQTSGPDRCTAEEAGRLFSHRARRDSGRQATFVWLDQVRS